MSKVTELEDKARVIREDVLEMLTTAGSGHPGGSLSAADILAVLYFEELKIDPTNPKWEDRDRFVLSKGHAAPVLYAALAEKGFFPKEDLMKLRTLEGHLQGHPDLNKTPGVDMTTGSLGQGFSAALGMALAGKLDQKDYRVFVMLGDGELQEGQVWEAALAAAHHKLDNLIGIVDNNRVQLVDRTEKIMGVEPITDKLSAFGWYVIEIEGHNLEEVRAAFNQANQIKGQPVMIVANTIKGKGVSFMEDTAAWHGKAPDDEKYQEALVELE
ncbi:transketolase [Natroniella sp. ANB-PHB2]|uniref:transketolase n=1 Tax=Natroniella sp. ANB-PHB2 TaxID=3384444 RepID=UPI0038D483A3